MDGIRDIVLVTVSEGVGTGVFSNGQLTSGHRGMAGEFGHVSLDPSGPRCGCGSKGRWEICLLPGGAPVLQGTQAAEPNDCIS